jgi:hypothetical protein
MGQTLSEPVVEKHSSHESDERLTYGASSMQGWRISTFSLIFLPRYGRRAHHLTTT